MNIVITGVGKGIGFELLKSFSELDKAVVFGLSRNIAEAEYFLESKALKGLSSKVHLRSFDLSVSFESYNHLYEEVSAKMEKVDILINNAGYLLNKPFEQITEDDLDKSLQINFKAAFRLTQVLLPLMHNKTHIVNISSMGGYQGSSKFSGLSAYSAVKGALAILSECLAEEFKEKGISVNSLALGAVQTEMLNNAFPGYKAPLKPEEMASFIFDFALNGHKYINGKIIPVSLSTP